MNRAIFYLSLIFGVLPFGHFNVHANIVLSYWHMFVVPSLYLICFGLVKYGPYGVYQLNNCASICTLSDTLFLNFGVVLYMSIQVLTFWRPKQFFIDFEKKLEDIDEQLRQCDKLIPKKVTKKQNKYIYYATWIVVVTIFLTTNAFLIKGLVNLFDKYFFIVFMASSFPFIVTSVVIGQFIHFVSEICKRCDWLVDLFERINEEVKRQQATLLIYDIEKEGNEIKTANADLRQRHNLNYELINKKYNDFSEKVEYKRSDKPQDENSSESNFCALFKLHDHIIFLSAFTNDVYGSQSVPYLTVCFVVSILNLFIQAKVYPAANKKNPPMDYVMLAYLLWSITTMVMTYILLRFCGKANRFSKQSTIIVHEIMQKRPEFMFGNDIYHSKMKSYNLQFLHWDRYFQFNGLGFFTLDYSYIFSIASSATSYLIITLQFDMSPILRKDGYL